MIFPVYAERNTDTATEITHIRLFVLLNFPLSVISTHEARCLGPQTPRQPFTAVYQVTVYTAPDSPHLLLLFSLSLDHYMTLHMYITGFICSLTWSSVWASVAGHVANSIESVADGSCQCLCWCKWFHCLPLIVSGRLLLP